MSFGKMASPLAGNEVAPQKISSNFKAKAVEIFLKYKKFFINLYIENSKRLIFEICRIIIKKFFSKVAITFKIIAF